jgi:hypothetical protein
MQAEVARMSFPRPGSAEVIDLARARAAAAKADTNPDFAAAEEQQRGMERTPG